MAEIWGLNRVNLIPKLLPLLCTSHHHWTPHSTLLQIQHCVENIAYHIQIGIRYMVGVCQDHVIFEHFPRRYKPGNLMTPGVKLMWVPDWLPSQLSIKQCLSILSHVVNPRPSSLLFSSLFPLSVHHEPKHSPPSHDDNRTIKDLVWGLETMATPCVDLAGWQPIGFGLWLGGCDHVTLALTTSQRPPTPNRATTPHYSNHSQQYGEG